MLVPVYSDHSGRRRCCWYRCKPYSPGASGPLRTLLCGYLVLKFTHSYKYTLQWNFLMYHTWKRRLFRKFYILISFEIDSCPKAQYVISDIALGHIFSFVHQWHSSWLSNIIYLLRFNECLKINPGSESSRAIFRIHRRWQVCVRKNGKLSSGDKQKMSGIVVNLNWI